MNFLDVNNVLMIFKISKSIVKKKELYINQMRWRKLLKCLNIYGIEK